MEERYGIFFDLLASQLGGRALDGNIADSLSVDMARSVYSLAKSQDMAHIIGNALAGVPSLDADIRAKFSKQQLVALMRYEQLNFELGVIRATFEEAGIDFIPLKGSVIRDLYPQAYFRTSCDIDILIHEEELDRAISLLTAKNYTVRGEKSFHDISLFSEGGIHLELHFNILENEEKLDRMLSRVWEFATPVCQGLHEYRMTNEYLMFHLVAHAAYHFITGGCGVKPVADIWILGKKLEFDRELLSKYCRECEIESFRLQLIRLADIWFEDSDYDELTSHMAEYILEAGVYGATENKVAIKQKKQGSKLGYLWRRIFIPYDDLKYYYPKLQDKKWLLPYYEVKRWCRLVFGGELKKSVNEIKTGVSMSDEKSRYVNSLLEKLEL